MWESRTHSVPIASRSRARSGQLPINATLYKRGQAPSPNCTYGFPVHETPHHLFVKCTEFTAIRSESIETTKKAVQKIMDKHPIIDELAESRIHSILQNQCTDSIQIWPLGVSQYYLRDVPKLDTYDNGAHINPPMTTKLKRDLHNEIHTQFIRLAGRIFGQHMRTAAKRDNVPLRKKSA